MTTYSATLTNAGAALYARALATNTPIVLATAAVGDGGGGDIATPDPTRSALVNQVYSGPITSLSVDPGNPSLMWAELDIPPNIGGFTVREVGLFTSSGVLFAISNFPDTYKPLVANGSSADLVINFGLLASNTSLITITIDPSVVQATRAWVLATITPAYLLPGGTQYQVLQKNSSSNGDVSWQDPNNPWEATFTTTGGVVPVSALQAYNKLIKVTGNLTSPATLTFPAAFGKWVVINMTTGNFTLTAIAVGGTGVPILQGHADTVHCDGANVYYSTASAGNRPALDASQAIANTLYVDSAVGQATPFRYVVPVFRKYGSAPAQMVLVGDTRAAQFQSGAATSITWSMPVLSTFNQAKPLMLRMHYTGDVAGNSYFLQLGYQAILNGPLKPASYTNLTEQIAAPTVAGDLAIYLTTSLVIPANTLTTQQWVNFVLTRLATNAEDTNAGNFQLINITMEQ
jgi:phage-related tail fiber protein